MSLLRCECPLCTHVCTYSLCVLYMYMYIQVSPTPSSLVCVFLIVTLCPPAMQGRHPGSIRRGATRGHLGRMTALFPFAVDPTAPPPFSPCPRQKSLLCSLCCPGCRPCCTRRSLLPPPHCNCCFTVECLNNRLQILCIYAQPVSAHPPWLGTSSGP